MKRKGTVMISGLLAIALAGAGIAGLANARPFQGPSYGPHEHHGMIPHHLMERLDLTGEQREAIREIRKAHAPEAREKFRALREIDRELHAQAMSADFDVHRARELAESRAGLQAELTVLRVSGINQAWQVLTDEQKAKLAEWRGKREHHGEKYERPHHRDGHAGHG